MSECIICSSNSHIFFKVKGAILYLKYYDWLLGNIKDINSKNKVSLKESFAYLFQSSYARYLALMVVSYNIVYNIADVLWTHQLDKRFADANTLNAYLAKLDFYTGIISVMLAIFIFSNVIRKFGWRSTALISPALWFITSAALYCSLMLEVNDSLLFLSYILLHLPFNELIIMLGTMQMCLGKASKYTIFDQSKEIAYIPLSLTNTPSTYV